MEKVKNSTTAGGIGIKTNSTGQLVLNALILVTCLAVFYFFIVFSGINSNDRASFAGMMTGEAHRPFVTRVLVPWLTVGKIKLDNSK